MQPTLFPTLQEIDPTALPAPATPSQPAQPAFKEPDLGPGEIGGFVVNRTGLQIFEKWAGLNPKSLPFHVRYLWDPVKGNLKGWFDVTLQSSKGETVISLREEWLYQLRIGDWVTVHSFVTDTRNSLARKLSVIKVPMKLVTLKLDVHFAGPLTDVDGEGALAQGFDASNRQVIFLKDAYKDHFGRRLRKRERWVQTDPYDAKVPVGGSFYSVLGLNPPPPPVSDEDVRHAYRAKSKETHPDLHLDDPAAGAKFQEVHEAYEAIKTQADRDDYEVLLQLSQQTFGSAAVSKISKVMLKEGDWPEGWYPPISSGEVTASGVLVGNTVVIHSITDFKPEQKNGKTRICAVVDGLPVLLWAH